MTSLPSLSIVIVETAGGGALVEAIQRASALAAAYDSGQVEVLLALAPSTNVSAAFTHCKAVRADTIPHRRLMALDAATTDILALIEDTILIDATWISHVRAPFDDTQIGSAWGPIKIEKALDPRSRALGALEYGRFAPLSRQETYLTESRVRAAIPGACMIFRTKALRAAMAGITCGIVEQEVATRLTAAGWIIVRDSRLICSYARQDTYGAQLSTRASHGRLYASGMYAQKTIIIRLSVAARAALVPLVLTARAIAFRSSARNFLRSVEEVLWIASMATAWAFGEAMGALAGKGSSEGSWR